MVLSSTFPIATPTAQLAAAQSASLSTILGLEASLANDPILDLCPSLELLKTLVRSSHIDNTVKRQKLINALLRASSNGDTDILSWLLDSRAEARELIADHSGIKHANGRPKISFDEMRDEDGTGPVVLASCAGHVDVVTILVLNGADVDERDACGWTPLMWATNSSNLALVSFLLTHGADVEARSIKGSSCEDFILSAAPEAATSPDLNKQVSAFSNRSHVQTQSSERDLIADLIYEHQNVRTLQHSTSQKLSDLNLSSPTLILNGFSSPSKAPALFPPTCTDQSPNASSPFGGHLRAASSSGFKSGHSRSNSQLTASRRLLGKFERVHLAEQELKAKQIAEGRKRALVDIAVMLEVDFEALVGEQPVSSNVEPSYAARSTKKRGAPKLSHSGLASGCGAVEVGSDILSVDFDWSTVRSDQMLVLGMADLNPLLDMLINQSKPIRAPWSHRAAPANVLFLCARYACFFGDQELLEELFLGAVDRIENAIYAHPTEMTHLSFWLYNCSLLHYYTQKDSTLRASPSVGEYRTLLADILNEIYVFVIRDAERRIDKVLDQAMLDHEAIPGFEEVRFEGEWKFMRTLAGSVKNIGNQGSMSSSGGGAAGVNVGVGGVSGSISKRPLSQIFSRRDPTVSDVVPSGLPSSPTMGGVNSPKLGAVSLSGASSSFKAATEATLSKRLGEPLSGVRDSVANTSSTVDLLTHPNPRTITTLLTSTLHILQLYEINPAIIMQSLSQIFFWVGCELFNRVITRKRYLCRSRAMQIRLNVSALEDWAKSNALPLSIVHAHLAPLSQLISWLQCQSSLKEFDGLIATMQGLKALNPLQLRKTVKDYRYEVGETRMSEECVQYLDQLIIDWKRRQEDSARQQREEARVIEMRKRVWKRRSSNHHRSGTLTQNGSTPDSRSPSPSSPVDELDRRLSTALESRRTDTSTDTATDILQEPLNVSEATAKAAQEMIDGLFLPGNSMADYVPPWTAAGPPLGLHDENGGSTNTTKVDELLNSRDMLPFALPRRPEALVVTPGDAFGFGRGHFTGTGTPSLRSVQGDTDFDSISSLGNSRPGSPNSVSQGQEDRMSADGGESDDMASVSGASIRTGTSNASRSSLFPMGKGFAAGASWIPVPLLPDGLLDKVNELMRMIAMVPVERRPSAILIESPLADKTAFQISASARLASPPPPAVPPRGQFYLNAEPQTYAADPLKTLKATRKEMYGYDDCEQEDEDDLSQLPPTKDFSLPSSPSHVRRQSGLSFKPVKLILPERSSRENRLNSSNNRTLKKHNPSVIGGGGGVRGYITTTTCQPETSMMDEFGKTKNMMDEDDLVTPTTQQTIKARK